MDLSTTYLGMKLRTPLVPAADVVGGRPLLVLALRAVALGAARADAFVGRKPAASTRAVTCAARPRAFHGACRACARRSPIGLSFIRGVTIAEAGR